MKERLQISKMDLNVIIGNLRKSDRYSEQQIQLIQDDLLYGLSKEETERYTQKNYDLKQMQVYSKCLRDNYLNEVIAVITADGLTGLQMEVALEFYEKGIPIETISKVAAGDMTAANMKRAYQRILKELNKAEADVGTYDEYVKQLIEEIKVILNKLDYQEQRYDTLNQKLKEFEITKKEAVPDDRYLKVMAEKDELLIDQQNKLNEAHAANVRLRNELEGLLKEKDKMQTVVNEHKIKERSEIEAIQGKESSITNEVEFQMIQTKEDQKVMTEGGKVQNRMESIPVYYGVPIGYHFAMVDGATVMFPTIHVEKTIKKSFPVLGIFSKLVLKKKSRQDLVKLITAKELTADQLVQIKSAIEKGLTEGQLLELIQNKISAEQMKEIIEIAVLENNLGE